MQTSAAGLAFIEVNEGFEQHIYNDNGHQAIGIGHDLLPGESFPNGISYADAIALEKEDAARIEAVLNPLVPPACTQNQYDSLIDFGFNLGGGALREMLGHGWVEVPTQMLRWVYERNAQGVEVVSPPLQARRQKEVALFNS
ncbi:MAG TPA: lysozyme [Terracidiphilus sp.]|jgi:GH24 family phage-related lysozyme (muramidase)